MDGAVTGAAPPTDLRLYSVQLGTGDHNKSGIWTGEATAFYVVGGTITFTIDPDVVGGTARVVAQPSAQPSAAGNLETIAAGGALFVDAQSQDVNVNYENAESTDAILVIASAMPCVPATASPTPDMSPGSSDEGAAAEPGTVVSG